MPSVESVPAIGVRVQEGDFDVSIELAAMRDGNARIGAITCFVGTVRDLGGDAAVSAMTLEHYPGMTEQSLHDICVTAASRWRLEAVRVVHRVGRLQPPDQIVLVAVAGAHRGETFQACEFVIDYLKTKAPFWKKESGPAGERWVEARASDDAKSDQWG